MSTIKATISGIILAIVSVSLTLYVIEVAIRRFYPQPIDQYNFTLIQAKDGGEMLLGHRISGVQERSQGYGPYIPNLVTRFAGVKTTINSRGWRDAEHILQKTNGFTRIMVVGDSVAFGYGVELDETFSKVLERELQGVGRYEVMTLGGAGGNTYAQKNTLKKSVPVYSPDLVILAFNLNDILKNRIKKHKHRPSSVNSFSSLSRNIVRLRRKLDALFRSDSHLYFLVRERSKAALRRFGIASPEVVPLAAFDMDDQSAKSAWRDTSEAVLEIADELRRRKIPLLLVILPVDMQMSQEIANIYRQEFGFKFADSLVNGKPQKVIAEFAKQHDIACLDLLAAFRSHPGEDKFLRVYGGSVDWNHPNRLGHEIIGKELAKALKSFAAVQDPKEMRDRRSSLPVQQQSCERYC